MGVTKDKYNYELFLVGDFTNNADTIDISWSDGGNQAYNTARSLETDQKRKLTRLGRFQRRSFDLQYRGNQPLRLEALELEIEPGGH